MTELAVYGNVAIPRAKCPQCSDQSLVVNGRLLCCDIPFEQQPTTWKYESEPVARRTRITRKARQDILDKQFNRCLYCDHEFGEKVQFGARTRLIVLEWDHVVPWSYSRNSNEENMAAACSICNGWKRNLMFSSLEEARDYLAQKWAATQGPCDHQVPGMRDPEGDPQD